ncbi:MAG: DNA (cytosine-5-)-methyltransferase [Victivallales bacterium]|jgi:DNA (cytosine-5)-methyltransferase 1|nr:DNA (cytosine-5-)-methyltransferase [Victivallales bacterium]
MKILYRKLWSKLASMNIDDAALRRIANISVRSVSKLERNEDVSTEILCKICDALQCPIADIVEFVDDPKTVSEKEQGTHGEKCASSKHTPPNVDMTGSLFDYLPQEPTPQANFRFIDLFAGIGGIRLGFESVGGKCVFSSEWDADAAKTYEANFGEKPHGDITKISPADIPDFDILLGGFPCQPFSIIGAKKGFQHETQGTLFFNIEEILKAKKPKAFMLENVRNLTTHDKGRTFRIITEHLTNAGYHISHKVLNALDYGVPQKRERIIIVGFRNDVPFEFPAPLPVSKRATISEILDPTEAISTKLFVKPEIRNSRLARLKCSDFPKPYISHENVAGSITPHNYSCALRAGASANYLLINDERRPSEREMLRIQGFPDSFKIVVGYGKIKHQTGNSVAVPVIKAVAQEMIKAMLSAKEL